MDFLAVSLADEDKLIAVAEVPGTGLVGMGYIYVWCSQSIWEQAGDEDCKSGMIDNIWVEPAFRKLGVFTAMLKELIAFAERRGVHELVLEYSVSNKEADETWTKLGFKPTGVHAAAFTQTVKDELSKRN